MFDPDQFVADLYSETVGYKTIEELISNSFPCTSSSCLYDSGWCDPNDPALLSYSYITLET